MTTIDPWEDYVSAFADRNSRTWSQIQSGRNGASELQRGLCEYLRNLTSDDYDLVVFGSLARGEWTSGSDIDWTLLIDGQASSDHRKVVREIGEKLKTFQFNGRSLPEPGREGVFGHMTFSHDIVHLIGGQQDSNKNTTQRVLLLLEAASISETCAIDQPGPFDRVIREILLRYLLDDTICRRPPSGESHIPRFLLNDIVRFWRTMCVDFAYKEWEQAGEKWALRNYKLRVSRKLLFISGLMTVFSCYRNPDLANAANGDVVPAMQEHLLQFVRSSPLQIVVHTLDSLGLDELCVRLLDVYERFLGHLNDEQLRERLARLGPSEIYSDPKFLECRELSREFQQCLNALCFETRTDFSEFIVNYGVF